MPGGTLCGTGISVGYYGEPGVPLLTLVAIQPVTSVGWRRPNVVALGHLVRVTNCVTLTI